VVLLERRYWFGGGGYVVLLRPSMGGGGDPHPKTPPVWALAPLPPLATPRQEGEETRSFGL
jgi:hypothetical protein